MLLVQNNVKPLRNMSTASPKLVKKGNKLTHSLAILLSAFLYPSHLPTFERERERKEKLFLMNCDN